MPPKKEPEVIQLERYRKAAEARAAKQAEAAKASVRPKERILGSRPNAGLLLLAVVVLIVAYVVARLFI